MDRKTNPDKGQITKLLREVRLGDRDAETKVMSLVYPDLRLVAARLMRRERRGHTLQATAIVHEAYLRLVSNQERTWRNRAHFFAVAAGVMRHILVDHARRHVAGKRGAGRERVDLDQALRITDADVDTVLEVDRVLRRLEQVDARLCRVVELRFFGGLTEEEAAEVLGISVISVKRDWSLAKAWLYEELSRRS